MGYCTQKDVENIIANSLTTGTEDLSSGSTNLVPLLNIGKTFKRNLITEDILDSHISISDSQIDAYLSQLYKTPFCENVTFEAETIADIDVSNQYLVFQDSCNLHVGDSVLITDGTNKERHIVETLADTATVTVEDTISNNFSSGTRVLRVEFPRPINVISSRLTAATIFDKYFSAQVSPNMSEYGKQQRQLGISDIEGILEGKIILHGQRRIGKRFINPNLVDQYSLPKIENVDAKITVPGG